MPNISKKLTYFLGFFKLLKISINNLPTILGSNKEVDLRIENQYLIRANTGKWSEG